LRLDGKGALIAKQIKPWHFVFVFFVYAFGIFALSYGVNALGHRFDWPSWVDPHFSFARATVRAVLLGVGMVGTNYFLLRKKETP
jgi:hypothetical protein